MKKTILALLIIFSGVASYAQVEKGDSEISLSGNFNFPTEGDGGNGNISVSLTSYLSSRFSAGIAASIYAYSGPDLGDPTQTTINYTPFIGLLGTYNILTPNAKAMPYISAQYDISLIETLDESGFPTEELLGYFGGKAGLKYFFTEMVNFDVNFRYQALVNGPEGFDAGNIGFNFGLGVIIPRGEKK